MNLQRMGHNGARRPGDQIAAGEGVVEFQQWPGIRNREAVIDAAVDCLLRGHQRLLVRLLVVLGGIGGIPGDGLLNGGLRSHGVVNFGHHFP